VKIGAIVLAAGGSQRFGRPKQLLLYDRQTLVRRAAHAALAVRGPIVVVAGREQEAIALELLGLPVTVVPNDHWELGIGSSLRCGLEALPECEAVVIVTCDQPRVDGSVVERLIAEQAESGKPIAASAYGRTLGVPALFGREVFAELRSLPDREGAKSIILRHRDEVALIDFPAGALDIDTPEDYARELARLTNQLNP
jgi:molybdenum cofactor cytidylyltransferase